MATSASAIPGPTTARLVEPCDADALERRHDAPHRAEQSDERRDARRRREERHARLELGHLHRRRAKQRPVDRVEALEGWTSGGRPLAWPASGLLAGAQLGIELRVAGLEQPDERTGRRACGRRPALPRTCCSCGRCRGRWTVCRCGAAELPDLVENDRPTTSRKRAAGWPERSGRPDRACGDEVDDVGVDFAGPSCRRPALRVQRKGVVSRRAQTSPPLRRMARRWDSAGSGKRNTRPMRCQTSDKMELPASDASRASLPPSAIWPSSTASSSSSSRASTSSPARPARGSRSSSARSACSSADAPRPTSSGRRGHGGGRGDLRDARRRAKSSSAARSRRRAAAARSSTARSTTSAALRELAAALVDLHGQHEHQVLLDPGGAPRSARRVRRRRRRARAASRRAFARWQQVRAERERLLTRRAREGVARGVPRRSSSPRSSASRRKPGEDEELTAARQVLANADRLQRLCAEAYDGAVRRGPGGAAGARQRLEKRRRSRRPRRALRPIPRGADGGEIAARGSRVLPALVLVGASTRRRRGCRRSRTAWRSSSV